MLISHKLKIIFVHVPKNAGCSITDKMMSIDKEIHPTRHLYASEMQGFFVGYPDYKLFAIIRNPFSRSISYYSYIQQNQLHYLHETIKNKTFKEFLKYLLDNRKDNPKIVETQYEYLFDNNGLSLVKNLLKFENLDEELKLFFKDQPLWNDQNIKINKINESKHDFYKNYYDDESIEIVKKLYLKDFIHLNYEQIL